MQKVKRYIDKFRLGKKLNEEITQYGADTAKREDDLKAAVERQGFNKRFKNKQKLKPAEQKEISFAKRYSNIKTNY